MTPPTTLLDRVRLRLRSRRALERAVAAAEQDRDSARALALGWRRERDAAQAHASHWRRNVGELVGWQSEGRTDGELHRRLVRIVEDGGRAQDVADGARGETEAALNTVGDIAAAAGCPDAPARWNVVEIVERVTGARDELEAVRAELRATGHPIGTRGLSYDVDAAIDRERSRAQDLVDRLGDVLGWDEYRGTWPFSAPHLVREVAVRLNRPMPRQRPRPSDWTPMGSRVARALRCTCRGDRGQGPTSIVDPQCAEHSPGYRFGGWPVQPLALPSGIREPVGWPHDLGCGHQLIRLTHGGEVVPIARCRWLAGHRGLHGNATGRAWTGEPCAAPDDVVDVPILDALDVWDGAVAPGGWVCDVCRLPVESEPCREHQPNAYAEMLAERDGVPF